MQTDRSTEAASRVQGSTFVFRLPAQEPGDPLAGVPAPGGSGRPLSGQRVLVVDDNRDVADSLAMLLECDGATVRAVYDGAAALAAAENMHPHAVLLDLWMPDMDGYEVAQRIRQNPDLEDVRIVALTGWGQATERNRTRTSGFDYHLIKPVDYEALKVWLTDGH